MASQLRQVARERSGFSCRREPARRDRAEGARRHPRPATRRRRAHGPASRAPVAFDGRPNCAVCPRAVRPSRTPLAVVRCAQSSTCVPHQVRPSPPPAAACPVAAT
eukprot:7109114-Prymnesium_polylepis.2